MAHGRESSGNCSYMDGVPVKISEKFKPPRKVTLPVGFQHRFSNESVADEYDFRLEHSVLKKMGEWRSLRKDAAASRKERIKSHEAAWQEKIADLKKFSLSARGGNFENITPENVATSSNTHSHPTVSSSTSHNFSFPNPISGNVSFSSSALNRSGNSYSNLEVKTDSFNVTPDSSSQTHQNVQYSHRTSILTPVPISQNLGIINASTFSSHFNISDFEADTSSPFDNMELKTINEMEELAHVLQPISNSPSNKKEPSRSDVNLSNSFSSSTSSPPPPTPPPPSSYNVNPDTTHYHTVGSKPGKESIVLPHINGLTGYNSYSTGLRSKERDPRSAGYINVSHNPYEQTSDVPRELSSMFTYYPQQPWSVNVSHPESYPSSGNGDGSQVTSSISPDEHLPVEGLVYPASERCKPLTSGISFPVTYQQPSGSAESPQQTSGRSLSKSVPDIVQELEKELDEKQKAESYSANRTSHTPPPRPNSFGSTGLEDWKPWPDLDSPEQMQSRIKKSPSKQMRKESTLPNPFNELSTSSQQLAKHISEMGFALPRVARACQAFGEDDKKVVEFLLQVQTLEEEDWPGDLAEKALLVNQEVSEAIKFLQALTQLLDCGFPEEKVCDALVRFQNNRDKALDYLIS